jgi:hypothetical protein
MWDDVAIDDRQQLGTVWYDGTVSSHCQWGCPVLAHDGLQEETRNYTIDKGADS